MNGAVTSQQRHENGRWRRCASRGAAEVEALRGNVAVELVERRKRGARHIGQLRVQQQARRVVLGGLGLAVEELAEDGERMERAREAPDEDIRTLCCVARRARR